MKKKLNVFLTVIILISACHSSKKTITGDASQVMPPPAATDTSASRLNGTWELNYISGPRIAFSGLYPEKKPTLIFNLPLSEASGNTSCNAFSCSFTTSGNKIRFGDPRSTMMACPGSGEQVFLKTLKQVNAYSINDDTTLTFIMGDIAMMRFVKK